MKLKTKIASLAFAIGCIAAIGAGSLVSHANGVSATPVTDSLQRSDITSTETTYANWSVTGTSGVVYKGNSYLGNGTELQIKSKDNVSGIVSTTALSEKKLGTITAAYKSGKTGTLNIYGKSTAYSSPADIYADKTKGTLVGTITATSLSFTFTQKFLYFAVGSASGTLYLTKLDVTYVDAPADEPEISIDGGDKNLDVNATGTFTATTKNAGALTTSWESSDSNILTVNASTGAYEAKAIGSCKVTAKLGTVASSVVTVNVNGTMTVDQAYAACVALGSGGTSSYFVTVKSAIVSMSGDGIKTTNNSIYFKTTAENSFQIYWGYQLVDSWGGMIIGGTLEVKGNLTNYKGTAMEMLNPVIVSYTDAANDFAKWANETYLDDDCAATNVTAAHWNDIAAKYADLSSEAKAKLVAATSEYEFNDDVATFVARYDNIVGQSKYSSLTKFMEGRTAGVNYFNAIEGDNIGLIVICCLVSISTLVAILFVIKRRKEAR